MRISEITEQPLGVLLDNFYVCQTCSIVDTDSGRGIVGHACAHCNTKGEGGLSYFGLPVNALINLMQESYHQKPRQTKTGRILAKDNIHQLAVIIYFCTFGEVLLDHFLREVMYALQVSNGVRERILNDNLFSRERVEKVFPSLVNEKWNFVIKELSKTSKIDYEETVKFYLQVVNARNQFLHRGNKWAIPSNMPEKCMEEMWPVMKLYAELHNRYVPAIYANQKRKYRTWT
ncbi:MAG: hypothetical protein QOC96_1339 [Acidobacteriota bacterium]|jgi:hypothetical protein|nr:hypothetical protein [Acidobacteriota bacterium]